MICPVCRQDMIVVEYHSIELDYCTGCKGVWFDAGELELLLTAYAGEEMAHFLQGVQGGVEAVSEEKKRRCPICALKMHKKAMGSEPLITVDVCARQHGIWFDGGELGVLVKHLAKEHPQPGDSGERVIGFLEEVFTAPD